MARDKWTLREKELRGLAGWVVLFVLLAVMVAGVPMLVAAIRAQNGWAVLSWITAETVATVSLFGLTVVNPNEAIR